MVPRYHFVQTAKTDAIIVQSGISHWKIALKIFFLWKRKLKCLKCVVGRLILIFSIYHSLASTCLLVQCSPTRGHLRRWPTFKTFVVKKTSTCVTFNVYYMQVTVCPKPGTPKMYQNGPQMSNYCAQLPPHTGLYIHGWPQIQKSPYGYTQGPKFIVFQNARIQTIFEGVKKTYFKFNQITMRPAYNCEELFFEQNI